ncbi:stress responsive A/B barrel domain-containing protein [Polychytrium aggregatum]|uniref:stress responsive A/B barrel domain-containing protein n=1 Tax=Polychytrium aggregatum TaxID=110093 RepID=UPI0022FDF293|nr:stress responsive A/B barrel domain-containing protein [Polychytrium aggregatum]KAI9207505.1 stress responsive A/B barrel domain-containing protein [Polychytrium aggregatum]
MAILHIVLFRIRADAPKPAIDRMIQELYGLKKLSGITRIEAGENFEHEYGQGYTHVLLVEFETREHLQAYDVHPDHVAVLNEHIIPLLEETNGLLAVDCAVPYPSRR